MKHAENRSQTWFKILTLDGESMDHEPNEWSLPQGMNKGNWFVSGCHMGTWLVTNPKEFIKKTNRVFVAELSTGEPLIELSGIIWVRQTRLVREATNLDLKRFGIYRAFREII